jgi:hypothetical protein
VNAVRKVCEMEESMAKEIVKRNLETIQTAKEHAKLLRQKSNDQFVRRPISFPIIASDDA